jgi:hypothetical protein
MGVFQVVSTAQGVYVLSGKHTSGYELWVARYTHEGILDPSFGTGGWAFIGYWIREIARFANEDVDGSVTGPSTQTGLRWLELR